MSSRYGDQPDLTTRIAELRHRGESLSVIAAVINAERRHDPRGGEISPIDVWRILGQRYVSSWARQSAPLTAIDTG